MGEDDTTRDAGGPSFDGLDVLGPCRLERELGRGGFGAVFEAVVIENRGYAAVGERVAVKLLIPTVESTSRAEKDRVRFMREAELGGRASHPSLVQVHEQGRFEFEGNESLYLIMELVQGRTLAQWAAESGPPPESLLRVVGRQLASALSALHSAGAVHRDVSPTNVMVTDEERVKLIDLGIALSPEPVERLTTEGTAIGNWPFMAPEQLLQGVAGPPADLYSLGATLYVAAASARTHDCGSMEEQSRAFVEHRRPVALSERRPDLSPFFCSLVHSLLEWEPRDWFASAAELASVLAQGEEAHWWWERLERRRHRGPQAALRRLQGGDDGPFAGREGELARLRAAFHTADGGEGALVLIQAESGAGKTRLLARFLESLGQDDGVSVLHGRALDARETSAASAFAESLREWFPGDSLRDFLARGDGESSGIHGALTAVLRGEQAQDLEQEQAVERLRAAVAVLVRALAREGRTIWIVEDLHAGASLDRLFLESVLPLLPSLRMLVVATAQPDHSDPELRKLLSRQAARRIELGPLSRSDVRTLLQDRMDRAAADRAVPESLVSAVHRRSEGHALFVMALAREIARQASRGLGALAGDLPLPASLAELIEARLSSLDEDSRELLEVCAVAGPTFDASQVAAVVERPTLAVMRQLVRVGRRHGLVTAEASRFRFEHELTREALLAGLPSDMKRLLHRTHAERAEEALELGEGASGWLHGLAALHWYSADEPKSAAPHLAPALEHHARRFEHDAVLRLGARARAASGGGLDDVGRCRALLLEAEALRVLGRAETALPLAGEAVSRARAARSVELQVEALISLARLHMSSGDRNQALDLLREAREVAADLEDEHLRRDLEATAVHANARAGRLEDARAVLEESRATERPDQATAAAARFAAAAGFLLYTEERHEEAREHLIRAIDIARRAEARTVEVYALSTLGLVEHALGLLAESWEHRLAHAELCRVIGFRPGEARALLNLGSLALVRGDVEAARDFYARQVELCRELGSPEIDYGRVGLAYASLWAGDLSGVRALLGQARRRGGEGGDRTVRLDLLLVSGAVDFLEGRLEQAETLWREALRSAEAIAARRHECDALQSLSRLARGRGREREAADWADASLRLAELVDRPQELALASLAAGLCRFDSDPEGARLHLRHAARLASDHELLDPGPLPAAWLAALGDGAAEGVIVDSRSPMIVRAEAHLALHLASGASLQQQLAAELAEAASRHLDDEGKARFWTSHPVARAVRQAGGAEGGTGVGPE